MHWHCRLGMGPMVGGDAGSSAHNRVGRIRNGPAIFVDDCQRKGEFVVVPRPVSPFPFRSRAGWFANFCWSSMTGQLFRRVRTCLLTD